jgi:hypothetical protein
MRTSQQTHADLVEQLKSRHDLARLYRHRDELLRSDWRSLKAEIIQVDLYILYF